MKLDSQVTAVITGGASGLGAATARQLASHGVKVALFDLNEAQGEALAQELGGIFCKVDVTSEEQVDAGFAKARAALGQERILVNCAGVAPAVKTVGKDGAHPLDVFQRVININLIGTFNMSRLAAAAMSNNEANAAGERGVIINTASVAAQDGQMGQASYSASKAGIVGMTLPIARDLMGDGIRVNTILPGIFTTPLLQAAPDNVKAALAATVPFPKRLGEPPEYAHLAETLITNRYLNGECIRIDGAIRMAPR